MKKYIQKLIGDIREWIHHKLLLLKNWAIKASKTQLYVLVGAVLFAIATYNDGYVIGAVLSILFMAFVGWWAAVKFGFVRYAQIDNDDLKE